MSAVARMTAQMKCNVHVKNSMPTVAIEFQVMPPKGGRVSTFVWFSFFVPPHPPTFFRKRNLFHLRSAVICGLTTTILTARLNITCSCLVPSSLLPQKRRQDFPTWEGKKRVRFCPSESCDFTICCFWTISREVFLPLRLSILVCMYIYIYTGVYIYI